MSACPYSCTGSSSVSGDPASRYAPVLFQYVPVVESDCQWITS